jgi:RNA polymerase-binding transcription factor DksA
MHYRYLTLEQRESLERVMRSQPGMAASLQRLHTPEYGVCDRCGADIPYVRLLESPETRRCAACDARS